MLVFKGVTYFMGVWFFLFSLAGVVAGGSFYAAQRVVFIEWEFFDFTGSNLVMLLLLDWMSLSFMGLVLLISSMIMFYCVFYMSGDKTIYGFIMLVYLFVFSMLMMIVSPNFISILLGWDGLGLVSYCLVIYYQNVKSSGAGMLTVLSNRVGDVAILLSIAWVAGAGSWNIFYLSLAEGGQEFLVVLFLVILAGMTKSAQIPFSAWLPAAMAAPTPVSALVHSSTLVTAGVYLLIRFNIFLGVSDFLFYVGSFTMVMSGLGANFETDLKKIIALSTLSQLGVMMMTLGLGNWELAFFHLLSHALFKSLLFMCAGVYIHGEGDTQDIRYLSGVWVGYPVSSFFFMGCSMSLCGAPFTSGFYSKDLILETYFMGWVNYFMLVIIFIGTLATVSYSVRLGYYIFWKNLGGKSLSSSVEGQVTAVPMSILFVLAISAGSCMVWVYFPSSGIIYMSLGWKLVLLVSVMLVAAMGYVLVKGGVKLLGLVGASSYFLGGMWFMPMVSVYFPRAGLSAGGVLVSYVDHGWVESAGGQGLFVGVASSGVFVGWQNLSGLSVYLFAGAVGLIFLSVGLV